MKLLLDENLSRRVVPFLEQDFPGSAQVALIGMERSSDEAVWQYAVVAVHSCCFRTNLETIHIFLPGCLALTESEHGMVRIEAVWK